MVRDAFTGGDEPELTTVLEALCDDDCREIAETVEGAMTASELSEACDVPLSTTYRKLDTMTEATLLAESTEIRADGRHTSRYRLAFEEVLLSVDEDHRLELTITRPARTADERLESLWSEVKGGI